MKEGDMEQTPTWKVDIDELVPFLGRTIYRAENVLVELCANSYDADAKLVEWTWVIWTSC